MAYIFSSLLRDVKNDRKAFTVIELIVVIAIIAILLALSVIAVNKIIRREHVVSEADRLASLLKEAQKYSMINKFYKSDNIIRERQYGVRIERKTINNQEDNLKFSISLVWRDLANPNNEIREREVTVEKVNLYKVLQNNQYRSIDNESIYFNDIGATNDNQTIRLEDELEEYKRDVVISQMGNINIVNPDEG